MDKPTQEQVKEFWELCGLKEQPTGSWYTDDGEFVYTELPPIDLEHIGLLFQYAVPLVHQENDWLYGITFTYNQPNGGVICSIATEKMLSQAQGEDPALALFWALKEARSE